MTAPPDGQEKAPRGATNASGGKKTPGGRNEQDQREGMFPPLVKLARDACVAWPAWLGSTWLRGKGGLK